MAFSGDSLEGRRWLGGLWAVALIAATSADTSSAADRYVVKRDGTKVRITRSRTELAATYRKGADVAASARRLAVNDMGMLVGEPGSARSRIKLLRVADAGPRRRRRVAADPDILEVHPVYRYDGVDAPLISTGTINVKLRPGLDAAGIDQLWSDYQLEVVRPIKGLHRVYVVKPEVSDSDEVARAELLAGDRRTAWAQPNFRSPLQLRQVVAQDEFYSRQWHLNNTGQGGGTVDADIDAPEAWEIAQGEDILVGMFDDACDVTHEDLEDNYLGVGQDPTVIPGAEGYDDPRPKESADALNRGNRHGTAVMGLIVASGNTLGVRGVAYKSRFTASRGMVAAGISMSDAEAASVSTFALEQGVDVHNNSWGFALGTVGPAIVLEAIETVFREGRDLDGPHGDGVTNRPPRGMVVVFSAGNDGELLQMGDDLSTLSSVIGVGASTMRDELTEYSNYGREIDVVAPGGVGEFVDGRMEGLIATTDNDDAADYLDDGYNIGGFDWAFGVPGIDPNGLYTGTFSGTSAAAPIVTGVVALALSVNPLLTATDVRLILEHTADKISPDDAEYDGITNRSLRYGYGRVNARGAVEAAQESLTNGGMTWPERVANASVLPGQVTWLQNGDPLEFLEEDPEGEIENDFPRSTDEFLILESDIQFEFIPEDGACYDALQAGCDGEEVTLTALPADVEVKALGCSLACGTDEGTCGPGSRQCLEFDTSTGTRYFAIYARSSIGRYSFGVSANSAGAIVDTGTLPPGVTGSSGGDDLQSVPGPKITVYVKKLGDGIASPLEVEFSGNASSQLAINDALTEWDFDVDDPTTLNSPLRDATYVYEVPAGETKVFRARLTMYDVGPLREGNPGIAEIPITVRGAATDTIGDLGVDGEIWIVINALGTAASTAEELALCRSVGPLDTCGVSPFEVEMRLEGSPREASASWDLGDGKFEESLSVTHTYVNMTASPARLAITATLRTRTAGGIDIMKTVSSRITVLPGGLEVEPPDVTLPGTTPRGGSGGSLCGAAGLLPLFLATLLLACIRRWR